MLASSFSRVLLPDPLRPTMPKNSPCLTSNETPSSARRIRTSLEANGWTIRSLTESTRCVGILKVFSRSRASIARGASGPGGPLRLRRDLRRRISRRALANRGSSGPATVRAPPVLRRAARSAQAAAPPCAGRRRTRSRPARRPRCRWRHRPARAGSASAAGTRPGSRRACGSSTSPLPAPAPAFDPLLEQLRRRCLRVGLLVDDVAAPILEMLGPGALRPLFVVGDHVLDRGHRTPEVEGEALVRNCVEEDARPALVCRGGSRSCRSGLRSARGSGWR